MKTLITLAALAAGAIAAPGFAQVAQTETLSRAVRVADLNLSDPAHVAKLDRRIGKAARAMCRTSTTYDLAAKLRVRDCIAKATADAARQRDMAVAAARGPAETRTASR
ncbi:UrcA family protein [Sphingomonas gilva]|uniref:UrcA family protein n=1 Tax=Sphingomonas gilva TaxID=2305907 RepID=A0A396RNP5_9SPHN|nr:UrcA family protein [Sphingomonas gilva]RHW16812.1 UrcA family protein [Sphingomonas gilva]